MDEAVKTKMGKLFGETRLAKAGIARLPNASL
jgi:hypothetical protein